MKHCLILLLGIGLMACTSTRPSVTYPQEEGAIYSTLPGTARAQQGPFQPDLSLFVCNMRVSNRPATNSANMILDYAPMIVAKGIPLATAPVNDACFSSGFGLRDGRMHKGIDLASNPGVLIYSAAPGVILEVSELSGFGKQVLIDHGRGVYTRYGHFERFDPETRPGTRVGFGVPLGLMGETGNATGIHLHYEILTGDYNTPRKSWGLKAHDPLQFPAWAGLEIGS